MRLLAFLAILIGSGFADSSVLRPCFERYANHRLVNLRPYHSEWRMRTEDMCLLFCAQSASRCRSVVYDTVQHICHYFSDEGVDQAILSAKMTYLRVVSQSCLQQNSELASESSIPPPNAPPVLLPNSAFPQNNDIQEVPQIQETLPPQEAELAIPQPPMEAEPEEPATVTFEPATSSSTVPPTTTVTQPSDEELLRAESELAEPAEPSEPKPEPAEPQIDEADLDAELKSVMDAPSQFTGSFDDQIDNNGVLRDKSSTEHQRWMGSMEKMDSRKKSMGKKTIDEKLEELKAEDKQKYERLMGSAEPMAEPEPGSSMEQVQELKQNLRYGAKVIKFDEESAFRKQSELRRKPVGRPALRPVTISSTSYIQKAKSFLDELNEDDGETGEGSVITTECRPDDIDVWIAFENSQQADEQEDSEQDSNVPSRKECQKICREKNCRSYTYFEKTHTCHLSSRSDGVSLASPTSGDFTASTSTKFCYPRTFSVFDGCSNFVAFRDYSVRIEAVEEFDGLPRGYDGMQLCVELCVLSTRYTCRSATFNPVTGKCRLLTEDSMTKSEDFKYDQFQKDLYFENGCTNAGNDQLDPADRNVEIVAIKPRKMKKRVRKVKKLRRRARH